MAYPRTPNCEAMSGVQKGAGECFELSCSCFLCLDVSCTAFQRLNVEVQTCFDVKDKHVVFSFVGP